MPSAFEEEVGIVERQPRGSGLDVEPVIATLRNMVTMEDGGFYINPTELAKSLGAKWSRRNILGMGNSPQVFEATEPIVWDFTLVLNANLIQRKGKVTRQKALDIVKDYMAFLDSLVFPVESEFPGWVGGEPPRVRFTWPGVVTAMTRVVSLKHNLELFQRTLHMTHGTVKVQLVVDPKNLYWSNDVRYLANDLV